MSISCWLLSPSYLLLGEACATAALGSVFVVAIPYLRCKMQTRSRRRTSHHCKCSAGFLEFLVVGWSFWPNREVPSRERGEGPPAGVFRRPPLSTTSQRR